MSTVGKALDILEAILKQGGEVGLTDLSNTTRLNISTTHRLCSLLVKRGYLCQKSKGEPYSLGLRLLQFNDIKNVAASIKEQAYPFLQRLCNNISETVQLSILNGIEPTNIFALSPKHILLAVLHPVSSFPLHCTSVGKAFLAHMTDEKIESIINITGLDAYTDSTITDKAQLKKEIEIIRRNGVAFDNEEYIAGMRGVAAPIKGENGQALAAISFVGPSVRISSSKMKQLAPAVKSCALEISQSLGYNGD